MEKVRYMISDAAAMVNVETHVLRYWEEELDLVIPRNEMGHRYYTRENIEEFQKIKELKEQGHQLKAIKTILHGGTADFKELQLQQNNASGVPAHKTSVHTLSSEERMDQFRELMSDIVGHAITLNNEELSQQIGMEVQERVLKEMNYLMREQDNAQEERYKKLDAAIRGNVHRKGTLLSHKKKEKKSKTAFRGKAPDKLAHAVE